MMPRPVGETERSEARSAAVGQRSQAQRCLVEGLEGRLGEQEPALKEGLTQLRLAFVQINSAMGPAQRGNGDERTTGPTD